jgi:hypothetical protein
MCLPLGPLLLLRYSCTLRMVPSSCGGVPLRGVCGLDGHRAIPIMLRRAAAAAPTSIAVSASTAYSLCGCAAWSSPLAPPPLWTVGWGGVELLGGVQFRIDLLELHLDVPLLEPEDLDADGVSDLVPGLEALQDVV